MKMIGKFSSMNHLSNQPLLRRKNQIKSIHSSLAIENNQLSESQVKDLINGKLVIGPQKDILEVQNAIKVYVQIQDIDPYAKTDLLKYHKILMTSLVTDAGLYRKGQVGVFDDENETAFLLEGFGDSIIQRRITIPLNARIGTTRMRIAVQDADLNDTIPLSCTQDMFYGEYEDYCIYHDRSVILGCSHFYKTAAKATRRLLL
jgi:hypothetical protein